MSDKQFNCVLCGGDTEAGWICDSGHSSNLRSKWVEGEAESTLFGMFTGGKKVVGKVFREITSYRCRQCGYLHNFAIEETDRPSI